MTSSSNQSINIPTETIIASISSLSQTVSPSNINITEPSSQVQTQFNESTNQITVIRQPEVLKYLDTLQNVARQQVRSLLLNYSDVAFRTSLPSVPTKPLYPDQQPQQQSSQIQASTYPQQRRHISPRQQPVIVVPILTTSSK